MTGFRRIIGILGLVCLAAAAAGCAETYAPVPVFTSQTAETAANIYVDDGLTFAVACEDEPETTYKAYQPLVEYLSRAMGTPVTLCIKENSEQVDQLLLNGDADVARISAGSYTRLQQDMELNILALESQEGTSLFNACIIVRQDSPIESFAQLRGKKFALVDEISNTGYDYPLKLVKEQGTRVDDYFCDVIYSGSHGKSIRAVYNGQVDGASVASYVLEGELLRQPEIDAAIKVIQRSPSITRGPYVTGRYLPPGQAARLAELLLAMDADPEGQAILAGLGLDSFQAGNDSEYEANRSFLTGSQ